MATAALWIEPGTAEVADVMAMKTRRMHTNSAAPFRVCRPGQLQCIAVDEVCIGRGHSQDDACQMPDVLHYHLPNPFFNVSWLIANRNLCDPRQIHQCHRPAGSRNDISSCTLFLEACESMQQKASADTHRTWGLVIFRRMGLSEMPLLRPTVRSVSFRISWRMRSKS